MRRRRLVALGLVAALGLLLLVSQRPGEAEQACLAALHDELELRAGTDLDPVSWQSDDEQVAGEWRYGSTRASSGVMPVGRGEVTCTIRGGEVTGIDVQKYAGTP